MNKAEKAFIFEAIVDGLTALAGTDKKALTRVNEWADNMRRDKIYTDGRSQSWTAERRERHGKVMRTALGAYCYRMTIFNPTAYGGGQLATIHLNSPEAVAALMGIKPHSFRCQLSAAHGKLVRTINHLPTTTERIPMAPNVEIKFVDVNLQRPESLVDILANLGVLSHSEQKVLANTPRARRGRTPSQGEGELPLPGGY